MFQKDFNEQFGYMNWAAGKICRIFGSGLQISEFSLQLQLLANVESSTFSTFDKELERTQFSSQTSDQLGIGAMIQAWNQRYIKKCGKIDFLWMDR